MPERTTDAIIDSEFSSENINTPTARIVKLPSPTEANIFKQKTSTCRQYRH